MIGQGQTFQVSATADATLETKRGYCVTQSGADTCAISGANERALGVLMNAPRAGEEATVAVAGMPEALVNGNSVHITYGDPLETDSGGALVKCTTDKHKVVAIALGAATADAVFIPVLMAPSLASI